MIDDTMRGPVIPSGAKVEVFLGHSHIRTNEFILGIMEEKAPGLKEKLSGLKTGEPLNLSKDEKEFFLGLVMTGVEGASNLIIQIAQDIWGVSSVEWVEEGKHRQENIAAALWWHFCSSNLSRERIEKLVDFYLDTPKEQAEKEISTWTEWGNKQQIKFKSYR